MRAQRRTTGSSLGGSAGLCQFNASNEVYLKNVREKKLKWCKLIKCVTAIQVPMFESTPLAPLDADERQKY